MLSNEQLKEYNHRLLKELQQHLNIMEDQCRAPSPDVNVLALEVGKCMKIYSLVSYIMGIYDGVDKTQGGFRESVKAHNEMLGVEGDIDFLEE